MPSYTPNLQLVKPLPGEPVDVSQLNANFDKIDASIVNVVMQMLYPVGTVYINASSAMNPATLLGFGTWERVGQGRMMLDANTAHPVGTTGGEETVMLTPAQSGVSSHTHTLNNHYHSYQKPSGSVSGGSHNHNLRPAHAGAMIDYQTTGSALVMQSTNSEVRAPSEHIYNTYYQAVTGQASERSNQMKGVYGRTEDNTSHMHTLSFSTAQTGVPSQTKTGSTSASATQAHNNMPPYISVYMWKRIA